MTANSKGALLALLAFALFSTHDVLVKFLGAHYAPFQIVFFSVLFSFPLVSFMLVSDKTSDNLRPKHPWWVGLRTGAIIISHLCVFYAFSTLSLADAYSILFTVPLMITILAIPILGEKVGLHRGAAVLGGLIGVIIVIKPGATEFSLGHLAAIIGAFFSALASVIVRHIGPEERRLVLLLFPLLGNFIIVGALMPLDYRPMPIDHLLVLANIALLSFLAFNFMIAAYKTAEAVVVAPMQYSQMIWAIIFGFLVFGEKPQVDTLIGTAIIATSGIYIVWREAGKPSSATPVLRTRSRIAGSGYLRIGPWIKKSSKRKKKKS